MSNATQGEHPPSTAGQLTVLWPTPGTILVSFLAPEDSDRAARANSPFTFLSPSWISPSEMFTGLVETVGTVKHVHSRPPGKLLTIATQAFSVGQNVPDRVAIGDSISINGCCLTVVRIGDHDQEFDFEAGEETLTRTNLGQLAVGSRVNLERSLAVGDRLGGHYVTGHVDAVGKLINRRDDPPWAHFEFSVPGGLARQIVSKGSIAVDGISLTVVDANEDSFSVALIPHTLSETTLGDRHVGDEVNLETDVLAKYVERSLQFTREAT